MASSVLPVLAPQIDDDLAAAQLDERLFYGRAPEFNFGPDGDVGYIFYGGGGQVSMTEDQRSLLTWIEKAIRTPRGRYPVYGPDYGTDLAANLGAHSRFQEVLLEGEEDLKRCLLMHPLIEEVRDVRFARTTETDSLLIYLSIVDRLAGATNLAVVI